MKTFDHNAKTTKAICQLSMAALISATVMFPAKGSAGVLDKAQGRVTVLQNKVKAKVANVKEKTEDLKGEAIEQIVEMVLPMLEFVREQQQGYKDFVGADNCGTRSQCGVFRAQFKTLLLSFVQLPQDLPFVGSVPPAIEQLTEAANLVDRMPAQFLYAAEKILGNMFDEVQNRMDILRFAASQIPNIPTMLELADLVDVSPQPMYSVSSQTNNFRGNNTHPICSAVLDKGKPHIALLQVVIHNLGETFKTIAGLFPDEQTVGINAVGGATISFKRPDKWTFQLLEIVTATIERKLTLRLAILNSVCAATGYKAP